MNLAARLAEVLMAELAPCDLGDGIEVVHDVEAVEVEMDCDVDDESIEDLANTLRFARDAIPADDTQQYVRYSAPYERIELAVDRAAYLRATIEEAQALLRSRRATKQ